MLSTVYTNALAPSVYLNSPPSLSMFVSIQGAATWFSGSLQIIAPSFVALPPSSTSYIYLNMLSGTVQVNPTGFTANFFPIATVQTSSFGITSLTDNRPDWVIGTGGGGGSTPAFETPGGAINGVNKTFTLVGIPNPTTSLLVFRNGISQLSPASYSLAGSTITFVSAPLTGDTLQSYYAVTSGGGGGGGSPNFVDQEIPTGTINGSNPTFTLVFTPNPARSLELFKNGVLQQSGGGDFTLSGSTITFAAGSVPESGATLVAWYRH